MILPNSWFCLLLFTDFIFICETGENLALQRPARQSSMYENRTALLAVDGYPDPDVTNGHCSETNDDKNGPNWLIVDLGSSYRIQRVVVTNRNDGPNAARLGRFFVGVTSYNISSPVRGSYPLCGQYLLNTVSNSTRLVLYCNDDTPSGRYVIIQLPAPSSYDGHLTICELEVYAYGPFERQYEGCYENISSEYDSFRNNSMTVDLCIGKCRQMQRTYAFLQNGSSCLCGDHFNSSLSNDACNILCANNSRQYCGGLASYSVYSVCSAGYFGPHCEYVCKCLNQLPCDIRTGDCSTGCDPNWSGAACNTSTFNRRALGCYKDDANDTGKNRDLSYPSPSSSMTVDKCLNSCKVENMFGYSGLQNGSLCFCGDNYGLYGIGGNCTKSCSGNRSESCGDVWKNNIYSFCPNGTYAHGCGLNCHCFNNGICFYGNGSCTAGSCSPGWTGGSCNVRDCSVSNGNCSRNRTCTAVDLLFANSSICYCRSGYSSVTPLDDCLDIDECMTGADDCDNSTTRCTNTVGNFNCTCLIGLSVKNRTHCQDIDECVTGADDCDKTSTRCNNTFGNFTCTCLTGFSLQNRTHCQDIDECLKGVDNCDNTSTTCTNTLGNFTCSCLKGFSEKNRTHCQDVDECVTNSDDCDNSTTRCVNSFGNFTCPCLNGYETVNRTTCTAIASTPSTTVRNSILGAVLGTVFGLIFIAAVVIVLILIYRRRRQNQNDHPSFMTLFKIKSKKSSPVKESQACLFSENIPVADLLRIYKLKSENYADFSEEFKLIPTTTDATCEYASQPELKEKNRYKNVLPYDENRVKFKLIDVENSFDYINASYIQGFKNEKYIATQGPMETTLGDFWRMIFEHNVGVIVMVTSLVEDGKVKCNQYWPALDTKSVCYGGVSVAIKRESAYHDYTFRWFQLSRNNHPNVEVVQAHFTTWPDRGTPECVASFLTFRRKVNDMAPSNQPVVVHCSAGIGRTGCFIAIDYLIKHGEGEKSVDVIGCVHDLRKQRPKMIQTMVQYEFIFAAISTEFSIGNTRIAADKFHSVHAKWKTAIKEQFKMLQHFQQETQRRMSNVDNKDEEDIIMSFNNKYSYTVEEQESNIRKEDFWKLIKLKDEIILLFDNKQVDQRIFIPREGESVQIENKQITCQHQIHQEYGMLCRVAISSESTGTSDKPIYANLSFCESYELSILHVVISTGRTPILSYDSWEAIYRTISHDLLRENSSPVSSVRIVCRTGLHLWGVYIAASNAIEMLAMHSGVDIFEIVEKLQKIKPGLISNMKNYEDLYDIIGRHLDRTSRYQTLNHKSEDESPVYDQITHEAD